jgi:hypothetical protein
MPTATRQPSRIIFERKFAGKNTPALLPTEPGGPCKAMVYVIKPRYRHLLTAEEWSFAHFLAVGKAQFEKAYFGFRRI